MANLPARQNESSSYPEWKVRAAELLAEGKTAREIAEKLAKGDKRKQYRLTKKIKGIAAELAGRQLIAGSLQTEMWAGMGPGIQALMRRAARGRPDAIKLLTEMTGFHNPRVQHEHSGDIKITLDLPRPPRRVDADIQDADVIED